MAYAFISPTRGFRSFRARMRGSKPGIGNYGSQVWYSRFYRSGIGVPGGAMDKTGGIRVRRDAGEWVRTRMRYSAAVVLAVLSGIVGLLAGVVLSGVFGWQSVMLPALCLAALAILVVRRYEKGGFSRLLKGTAAERNVGGSIEYALTTPGCAVAHSVTEIADIGDIDHLVATPSCLWVVETKYRKVPNERFAEVLRRIRVNLEAVRRWAPPGTDVRGCLVLATENGLPRKRMYENGQVEVFNPKSLVRELKRESMMPTSKENVVTARRVWELAGGKLI